jgi:hypothetical protein
MTNLKKFIKHLIDLGFNPTESKYDSDYYDSRGSFVCNSLSEEMQQPVTVVSIITTKKICLELTHGNTIILRPIQTSIDWDSLTEMEVNSLASNYFEKLKTLTDRARYLMEDIKE